MPDISSLTKRIIAFRDDRDWKQFHTPKDLAIALVLEATEVLEHFQWKNVEEMQADLADEKKKKAVGNEAKYPVEKAKGRNVKYTEL